MSDVGLGANQGATPGTLERELKAALVNGRLPCATAWEIAARLKTGRNQVGNEANRLGLKIADCQLGCFKTRKATHEESKDLKVDDALASKLREASHDGLLSCASACKIAAKEKVTPKQIGEAATVCGIKIARCQLGCF